MHNTQRLSIYNIQQRNVRKPLMRDPEIQAIIDELDLHDLFGADPQQELSDMTMITALHDQFPEIDEGRLHRWVLAVHAARKLRDEKFPNLKGKK